jgi:hypothetical protein
MMLLTRESEKCLRESLVAKLNADATAAASNMNGQAAVEHSPSKSVANDCYSLVAVFSHTVVFSCRRHVLHTALDALANSAERLGRSIDTDFPYRVAAGDNIGTTFEIMFITCSSKFVLGDLYSWHCPLLHMLPVLQQPQAQVHKRQTHLSDRAKSRPKHDSPAKFNAGDGK